MAYKRGGGGNENRILRKLSNKNNNKIERRWDVFTKLRLRSYKANIGDRTFENKVQLYPRFVQYKLVKID